MALTGSAVSGEVGLRLLLSPAGSNIVARTACCAVGIVLPVYSTFKAIENKDSNEQDKWLVYWAAYGSFTLVESLSDKLISWVPFYYHVKFAFLVWLQLPSHYGARQLYQGHLRPFFRKHQANLDTILKHGSRELEKLISRHQQEISFLGEVLMKGAAAAAGGLSAIVHPARRNLGLPEPREEAPPESREEDPPAPDS